MRGLRRPTLDESNRLFTAAVIGGGAVAGSTISVLFGGALIAGVARLFQGRIALPTNPSVRWIGACFAAFFFAEAISTVVNYTSPVSLLEGVVANLPFLGFLMIYGRLSLSSREDILSAVEFGSMAGSFGALGYALIETMWFGYERAEGLAGNSGPFALVCTVLYGFNAVTAVRRRDRIGDIATLAMLAAGGAVLLSGMRSMWPILVLAPLIPLAVLRFRPRMGNPEKTTLILAALLLIVIVASFAAVQARVTMLMDDYDDVSVGEYDNSLGQRIRVWRAAAELVAERPLLGHGPAEAHVLMAARAADDGGAKGIAFTHAHNSILNAWMRSGILGAISALAILLVPPWLGYRARKDEIGQIGYAMLTIVCMTYFIAGIFNACFHHDIMDVLFIYSVITSSFLVFGNPSSPTVSVLIREE
ncbi:MAG: O-antigen ligase family protein [Mesorhizobium sp.]|nr:O-antigen ligase family protein [Mesorhizobium sp.]